MTARILDGNAIRDQIYAELQQEIASSSPRASGPGSPPFWLAIIPPRSHTSTARSPRAKKLGLESFMLTPPATISTADLLAVVDELNRRDDVDGILVQMPLPQAGRLEENSRRRRSRKRCRRLSSRQRRPPGRRAPDAMACTPSGVMEILRRSGIALEGANAVVMGRSDIVGKPMALLLMHANATVTVCHSKSRDLPEVVRRADIVVAAMGRAAMVTSDYIRPGATVIDVGQNVITDRAEAERIFANFPEKLESFAKKGSVLVGDVHPDVVEVAGAFTPVPGGVGPLTIAMLMSNTVKAARMRRGQPASAGWPPALICCASA